jgi:putative FmdB family regulatory protein
MLKIYYNDEWGSIYTCWKYQPLENSVARSINILGAKIIKIELYTKNKLKKTITGKLLHKIIKKSIPLIPKTKRGKPMPIYKFRCAICSNEQESALKMNEIDNHVEICSECGEQMKRLMGKPRFILKGSGFYGVDKYADMWKDDLSNKDLNIDVE